MGPAQTCPLQPGEQAIASARPVVGEVIALDGRRSAQQERGVIDEALDLRCGHEIVERVGRESQRLSA